MILVDTSVWIEFFKRKQPYFSLLAKLLEERQVAVIECIMGELLQGARSEGERNFIEDYWLYLPKIDEKGIWLMAGNLSSEKKLYSKGGGLIDIAILIAARRIDAQIWTLDKKIISILTSKEIFKI